ncbi:Asp23/Gls24 family envelope stress response protein [Alkalicoccus halolimnae]|uniref:Asp23/Gls24 family envelope stress response protein n=1 Tax=Alkalicoccus halolimnae TaxID=1667239 RepID=A0A5C7FAD7_9BACI|nr:Asp23/Gls24 family envelope stress response protein [Alkalicoccus halolimnae]TXF86368.1 Asp23/Gls24 family envelope stress response protein [Alkalicoccus halolimnae]
MAEDHVIKLPQHKNDLGKVEISPDVIEIIAGLAASEIEGVAHLRGNFASGVAERLGRKSTHGKGVKAELDDEGFSLDVYLVTNYGSSIPEVGRQVQENIIQTLKTMTAIDVLSVNIHVTAVEFEGKENPSEPSEEN